MNREIKFRAWISPGKMQYNVVPFKWDFCIDTMWLKCIESTGKGLLGSGGNTAKWEVGGFRYMEEAEKNLMQFAGLKDKNGKEIYEGDVVTCRTIDNGYPHTGKIEFMGGYFIINVGKISNGFSTESELTDSYTPLWNNEQFEVIGNIYETPELLQNAKA